MPTITLAHYELLERLGRGGMGVVYRARDTRLERDVAIKLLPGHVSSDAERRSRFLREARAAARLNHPNIATIYEVGEAEAPAGLLGDTELVSGPGTRPVLYLAMELVPGEDLGTRLAAGPLPEDEVVELARQVAQGLDHAHRAGVVHRDMKPHNLRLTPEGIVKILDFGLAKLTAPDSAGGEDDTTFLTTEGMILGTAPYMSPEQVQGEGVDARSDLFSFGVVLYQMISGTLPFESGGFVRYVRSLVHSDPRPLSEARPGVSPELERIVARLLAKDPEARYPSAAAVLADLAELLPETGSRTPGRFRDPLLSGLSRPPSWRLWLAGHRRSLAAGLLLALLLGAGALWLALRPGTTGPPVTHVAVLPFENQTSDPSLDAYYEGIGTALARKLASVPGVNVVPELDVRRYRDTDKTAEEISRELDVGTLIQGYVQGGEDRVVVDVQVANAAPYMSLWERTFEEDPDDLLLLQERLVDQVLRHLPVSLSARERRRLRENPTASREAWDAYFRGSALLEQVDDAQSLEQAAEYFERAVEIDSEFAWAHAALSEALWRLSEARREPSLLERALGSADRAVALGDGHPHLKASLSQVQRKLGQTEAAIATIETALEAHPDSDRLHRELGSVLWEAGQKEAARQSYERAVELRPSYWGNWNEYGAFLMRIDEYDQAGSAFNRARELAPPEIVRPLENLGSLALFQGDTERALAFYEQIPAGRRTPSLFYNMGLLYAAEGQYDQAAESLRDAVEASPAEPVFRLFHGDLLLWADRSAPAEEEYERASQLLARQLAVNPNDLGRRAQRLYALARLDRCAELSRGEAGLEQLTLGSPQRLYVARAYAVCGDVAAARREIDLLLESGVPAETIRGEIELRPLLQ